MEPKDVTPRITLQTFTSLQTKVFVYHIVLYPQRWQLKYTKEAYALIIFHCIKTSVRICIISNDLHKSSHMFQCILLQGTCRLMSFTQKMISLQTSLLLHLLVPLFFSRSKMEKVSVHTHICETA